MGASYFILEDYLVSIREGEKFRFSVDPKISAFNVLNSIEEDSANLELAWFVWDAEEDSDWTLPVAPGESYKTSWNDTLKVEYETKEIDYYGQKVKQNDKRATLTGLKAGVTYVIISVANDPLIVGAFKVEVRPGDEFTVKTNGTVEVGEGETHKTIMINDRVDALGRSNKNLQHLNDALGSDFVPATLWQSGNYASGSLYQGMYDSYNTTAFPTERQVNIQKFRANYGMSVGYPSVSSGTNFTIALAGDGTVWAWGANDYGQLGQGDVYGTTAAPQQVISQVRDETGKTIRYEYLNNVRKIVAAGGSAYALKNDGTVWTWGRNDSSQLGLGESYATYTRVPYATQMVKGAQGSGSGSASSYTSIYLQEIVDIAAGGADDAHGFAMMIQTVYYRRQSQCRDEEGNLIPDAYEPKNFNITNNVFGVGDNAVNQLGVLNTAKSYSAPVAIRVSSGIAAQVSAGTGATGSVLVGNGTIMSMGDNTYGQLGNGANTGNQGSAAMPHRAMAIGSGQNSVFALTYRTMQTDNANFVQIANYKHKNDITANLYGWGRINNAFTAIDEEGATITTSVNVPTLITDVGNEMQPTTYRGHIVAMGGGSTLYTLDQEGRLVFTGGSNDYGQQGTGKAAANNATGDYAYKSAGVPIDGSDGKTVLSADSATGGYFTAMVDSDGIVWGFGQNNASQLGSQGLAQPYSLYAQKALQKYAVDADIYEATLILEKDKVTVDSKGQDRGALVTTYESTFDLFANYTVTYTWNATAGTGFNLLGKGADGNPASLVSYDLKDLVANTNMNVLYQSLDPQVATVNAAGQVTATGYGETYILVTIQNAGAGDRTLQFKIRVATPYEIGSYARTVKVACDACKADDIYVNETDLRAGTAVCTKCGADIVNNAKVTDVKYDLKVDRVANAYATVAVGEDYTLALKADGSVWAWGRNTWGQLGVGFGSVGGVESTPQKLRFTKLVGYTRPNAAPPSGSNPALYPNEFTVAEYARALRNAINDNDRARHQYLQSYLPKYGEVNNIVKIAAGLDFAMALDSDGIVYTWGRNTNGQIGNGLRSSGQSAYETVYPSPTAVAALRELHSSGDDDAYVRIVDIYAGSHQHRKQRDRRGARELCHGHQCRGRRLHLG